MITYRSMYGSCAYTVCIREYADRAHVRIHVRTAGAAVLAFHNDHSFEIRLPGVRSTELLADAARNLEERLGAPATNWTTFLAVHQQRMGFIADRWYTPRAQDMPQRDSDGCEARAPARAESSGEGSASLKQDKS